MPAPEPSGSLFTPELRAKCIAEIVGTFMLLFIGTGAAIANDVSNGAITHVGVALCFGLVVMAVIYAVGDISGAHLNPAVTLGFLVAKRFPLRHVAPYLTAQLLGAFLGSLTLRAIFPAHDHLGSTLPAGSWQQSFILELVLTAILMAVILCVSTGSREKGVMAGAAIGAVIAMEAMMAGPICGASMNPARSIAPAIVSGATQHLWLYIVAPIAGAIISVPIFRAMQLPRVDSVAE